MSLADLDLAIETHLSVIKKFPDESGVKAAFQQSMVAGSGNTVKYIKSMNVWPIAKPILYNVIQDIPVEENPEIAGRIFNVMETLYPKLIDSIAASPKKTMHAGKIISELIQEIRNGAQD